MNDAGRIGGAERRTATNAVKIVCSMVIGVLAVLAFAATIRHLSDNPSLALKAIAISKPVTTGASPFPPADDPAAPPSQRP